MTNPISSINDTIQTTVDTVQAVQKNVRTSITDTLKGMLPGDQFANVVDTVARTDETVANNVYGVIKQLSTTVTGMVGGQGDQK